jgi:hypothetical protein
MRIMSFSEKVHRSQTFVLFTLWPGHEIDVETLAHGAIPNLHDAFAIDGMKAVTCTGLASKLAQRRVCYVKQGLVQAPPTPHPLGDDPVDPYAKLSRIRLRLRLRLHFIWQRERLQHGGEAQHVMREEPALVIVIC